MASTAHARPEPESDVTVDDLRAARARRDRADAADQAEIDEANQADNAAALAACKARHPAGRNRA